MLVLNVTYKCKPDMREEFMAMVYTEGVDIACRTKDGNIKYDYYTPVGSSDDLLLDEKWRNADALAAYGRQPHYARLGELKAEYVDETVIEKLVIEG